MKHNTQRDRTIKPKEDKSKFFVIDLDGTICNIDIVFFKLAYALSYFGLEVPESFLDEREYITLTNCGILAEEDETRILALMDVLKTWETLDPFPGVTEFLQKISFSGHRIIYLTSRRSCLRGQTTNWFKNNSFPRPPDTEYGNESPSGKVTLMMNGPLNKKDHLSNILKTGKEVHYFENDPFYVEQACKLGVKNIYSFKESYIVNQTFSKKVNLLPKPKTNAYARLSDAIFK